MEMACETEHSGIINLLLIEQERVASPYVTGFVSCNEFKI